MGFRGDPVVGLLFPGQGSQFVGMGRDLAEASDIARRTFEEADDLLGFALSKLCWDGPEAVLTATNNAQPAILTHSIAAYRVLVDAGELSVDDVHVAAGHSLGEFTAYVAAGAISFEEGLRTVRLRGELMYRAGQERSAAGRARRAASASRRTTTRRTRSSSAETRRRSSGPWSWRRRRVRDAHCG